MSARKVPTQWDGQQQLELQLPHRVPIDSARVPAHLTCTSLASLPPHRWLPRACMAAPPLCPYFSVIVCGACVDKKSSCTLYCGRNPEVPGAAVYHVRRVVRTCARVIERNRALIDKRKSLRSPSRIIDQRDPREKRRDGSDLRGEKIRLMQLRLLRRGPHEAGRSGKTPLILHSRPTSRVVSEELTTNG